MEGEGLREGKWEGGSRPRDKIVEREERCIKERKERK
jgi:hypothetical protein